VKQKRLPHRYAFPLRAWATLLLWSNDEITMPKEELRQLTGLVRARLAAIEAQLNNDATLPPQRDENGQAEIPF